MIYLDAPGVVQGGVKMFIFCFLQEWAIHILFWFILVFSNNQFNFYNKLMWKTVHPVSGGGIRTHNVLNWSFFL